MRQLLVLVIVLLVSSTAFAQYPGKVFVVDKPIGYADTKCVNGICFVSGYNHHEDVIIPQSIAFFALSNPQVFPLRDYNEPLQVPFRQPNVTRRPR